MSLAWLNFKTRPNQFGDNKNKPGRKHEYEQALKDAPKIEEKPNETQ